MKLYLCLTLLLLAGYAFGENCEDIKPSKPSDCVLSKEDKKRYKYCCYSKGLFGAKCSAYSQGTKDIIDELEEEYNVDAFTCNNSSFISLGLLLFISFIIF